MTNNALQLLFAKLSLLLCSVALAQTAQYPVVGIPAASDIRHSFATSTLLNSPAWVDAYVRMRSKEAGVNPNLAAWIVLKESQDGQNLTGDDGNSRGAWQISKTYHPEVSDSCAYDLTCSTEWALKRILEGKANEWSTARYCRAWWPETCPL